MYRLSNAVSVSPKIHAVTITTKPVPAFTNEKELSIQGFLPVTNYREYDIMPKEKELVMVVPLAQQTSVPLQANLLAAELNMKKQGKMPVVTSDRFTGGGTKIPSLQEASKIAKPKIDIYRAFNTVQAFLGGDSVMTPYIPGSAVGTREIRQVQFWR